MTVPLLDARVERRQADAAGFSSSSVTVPSTTANLPRTVVTIMCLAENRTSVWAGSTVQVLVAMSGVSLRGTQWAWLPLGRRLLTAQPYGEIVALSTTPRME